METGSHSLVNPSTVRLANCKRTVARYLNDLKPNSVVLTEADIVFVAFLHYQNSDWWLCVANNTASWRVLPSRVPHGFFGRCARLVVQTLALFQAKICNFSGALFQIWPLKSAYPFTDLFSRIHTLARISLVKLKWLKSTTRNHTLRRCKFLYSL